MALHSLHTSLANNPYHLPLAYISYKTFPYSVNTFQYYKLVFSHIAKTHFWFVASVPLLQMLDDFMSSKKLAELLRKWQRGKRSSKGHFVVYTKEGKRFVVPLYYLNHPIFKVLLEMAEEEFGPVVHGPLKVPCEEELMGYIVSLLRRNHPQEVERALVSMTTCKGASLSSFFPVLCHAHDQGQDTLVSYG